MKDVSNKTKFAVGTLGILMLAGAGTATFAQGGGMGMLDRADRPQIDREALESAVESGDYETFKATIEEHEAEMEAQKQEMLEDRTSEEAFAELQEKLENGEELFQGPEGRGAEGEGMHGGRGMGGHHGMGREVVENEAVEAALESGNFEDWKTAMTAAFEESLTEDKFEHMQERHENRPESVDEEVSSSIEETVANVQ